MARPNGIPPLLTIRLEGPAIGRARISVDRLVRLLSEFTKAVHRSSRLIEGESASRTRGPRQKTAKERTALDVVLFTEGSKAAVIGLDRANPEIPVMDLDPTFRALQLSIDGLGKIQEKGGDLPDGVDLGVLLAWKELGVLFSQGVTEMKFSLRREKESTNARYTPEGFQVLQEKIKGPITNVVAVEGRLMMADFKEQGTRCRIHPESGPPILCLFREEQLEGVLENILHYVRIVGDATINPNTEKIETIRIVDIEAIEENEDQELSLLPQGTLVSSEFWVPQSFDDLVRAQGVVPLNDPTILFGTWPGDPNDGFEERNAELRRMQTKPRH